LRAANSGPIAAGLTVFFSATIGSGTNPVYQWNFGDGKFGSKAVANHIYLQSGIYTAIVTATNTAGALSAPTTVTVTSVTSVTSGNSIYLPLLLKM
jgi:PKD repeat protein